MLVEKKMAWTPERVETLKKMWADGQSASQIAGELGGVTRNAVIGKIHRLGLSNRVSSPAKENKESESKVKRSPKQKSRKPLDNKTQLLQNQEKANEKFLSETNIEKSSDNSESTVFLRPNKNLIFAASQPLPPQPSTSEISKETLENVKSIEKKSKKLSLMELTERTCKWPIGDPATETFWFCGHPAEQGKPYCETHIEIAFQPVAARRDRKSR